MRREVEIHRGQEEGHEHEGCEVQLGSSHDSLQSAAATRQQGDVVPEIGHSEAALKAAPTSRRCKADDDGDLDREQMHMWGLDEKPAKGEVDEWQVNEHRK